MLATKMQTRVVAASGRTIVRAPIVAGRRMTVAVRAAKEPTSQGQKAEVLTGQELPKSGGRGNDGWGETRQGSNNQEEGNAPDGDKVLVGERTQTAKGTKPLAAGTGAPAGRAVDDVESVKAHERAVGLTNDSKPESTTGGADRVPPAPQEKA